MKYFPLFMFFLIILFYAADVHAAVIVRPVHHFGLVGYWDFQEGQGMTAYDKSGNSNHGTLTNMDNNDWVDSKSGLGKALDFDGTDDYVDAGNDSSFDISNEITLSAWIKAKASQPDAASGIITKDDLGSGRSFNLHLSSASSPTAWALRMRIPGLTGTDTVDGTTDLRDNAWHYVAGVWDGSTLKVYVDGAEENSVEGTGTITSSSVNVRIGNFASGTLKMNGSIDEARIYNRALSAGEIRRLYNLTKPRIRVPMSEGLVGYWDFQEGQGMTAHDKSGNSNHGTLTNMDSNDWVDSKSGLGKALDFDGSNDTVSVDYSSSLATSPNMSISAWFNASGISTLDVFISKMQSGGYWLAVRNDGTCTNCVYVSYSLTGGGSNTLQSADNSITTNEWHHALFNVNGTQYDLYLDGKLVDSNTETNNISIGTTDFCIAEEASSTGCDQGYNFKGMIDEVRLYNRALSADEVKRLYNLTKPKVNASQVNRLTNGLVGYWTFDGPDMDWAQSSAEARDVSGNGNHGDVLNLGQSQVVVGKVGQALEFDGVDDYVDLSVTDPTGGLPVTISLWAKADDISSTLVLIGSGTNCDAGNRNAQIYIHSSGEWRIDTCGDATTVIGSGSISTDRWYHLVGVWESNTFREFYLDGLSQGSNTVFATTATDFPVIGSRDGSSLFFNGLIDEVRIYNRVLSPEEIKRLYNMGR